jgi:hypothetical protein
MPSQESPRFRAPLPTEQVSFVTRGPVVTPTCGWCTMAGRPAPPAKSAQCGVSWIPWRAVGLRSSAGKVIDVADSPRQGIFISYRHADTLPYARLLQISLHERFPDARVFMDLDSIEAGVDFRKVISDAVNACGVVVVLIGPQWASLADGEGRRRLDDPDDYVRFEIRTALKRGARVIPVLVEGARPVGQRELPPDIRRLARLNVLEMSCDHRYQYDADRLMRIIDRALGNSGRVEARC